MSEERPFPARPGPGQPEPLNPPGEPQEPTALGSLNASRAQLRAAWAAIAHPPKSPSLWSGGVGGVGKKLLERAERLPAFDFVTDGIRAWWSKQPLNRLLAAGGTDVTSLVSAAARKRPGIAIISGAVLGVLVIAAPWRLLRKLVRPILFSGIAFEVIKAGMRRGARTDAAGE